MKTKIVGYYSDQCSGSCGIVAEQQKNQGSSGTPRSCCQPPAATALRHVTNTARVRAPIPSSYVLGAKRCISSGNSALQLSEAPP